jgi:hypothetical protein
VCLSGSVWCAGMDVSSKQIQYGASNYHWWCLGVGVDNTQWVKRVGQNPFLMGQNMYRGHMYGPIQTQFGM